MRKEAKRKWEGGSNWFRAYAYLELGKEKDAPDHAEEGDRPEDPADVNPQ